MTRLLVASRNFRYTESAIGESYMSDLRYIDVGGRREPADIGMGTGEEPGLNSGHVGHLIPHYIMGSLHFKHIGVCKRPGFALGSEKLELVATSVRRIANWWLYLVICVDNA